MNDTATSRTSKAARPSTPDVDALRRQRRWALLVPALGLAIEMVVLARSLAGAPDLSLLAHLAFVAWWALPFVLTGLLMSYASGRTKVGWWSTIGLAVALGLSGLAGYVQMRLSADASLIGLSGPLVQDGAVLAVGVAVLVTASSRSSRRSS